MVARDASGAPPMRIPQALRSALSSETGEPLPDAGMWARRIGADLPEPRIVMGPTGAAAAASIAARAFTVGNRIFFGEGRGPHTDGGALLQHELVHVAQQRGAAMPAMDDLTFTSPGDDAEREARAGDVVGARPAVIARDEEKLDKVAYVHSHLIMLVEFARSHLIAQKVATFSQYASWTGDTALATAVAVSALPGGASAGHLQMLLQPADLYDIADRARVRDLDDRGAATDTGKPGWQLSVGQAVGAALAEKLTDSVKRMMPRYLDARYQALIADENETGECREPAPEANPADITPSHPLDTYTIPALCSGIVRFDAGYRSSVTGDGPLFRRPEEVAFSWQNMRLGAYWIKVTGTCVGNSQIKSPADATAEDVALTLFGTPSEAHEIVAAPPLFGFTHAYKLLQTFKDYLTSIGEDVDVNADPTRLLLESGPAADDAALAQTQGQVTAHSSVELAGFLGECVVTIDKIAELAKKFDLGGDLRGARDRIEKRKTDFSKPDANFAEVSKWSGHTIALKAVLSRIAFGMGSLDERLTGFTRDMRSLPGAFADLNLPHFVKDSMKRVAAVFVDAAAVSHLPATAEAKAAVAERENQMLPVAILEGVLTEVLRTIDATRRHKNRQGEDTHPNYYPGTYHPDTKEMEEQEKVLRAELATLRTTLLNDPMAAVEAFRRIQEKVLDLQLEAEMVGSADELDRLWKELESAIFRSPIIGGGPLPTSNPLWDTIHRLQKECLGYRAAWEAAHKKFKAGDKKAAKEAVQKLRTDPRLPAFFGQVQEAFKSADAIETINKIVALLAITVITIGVGAWATGLAAGLELGTGATILTVSAAEAVTFTILSQAILDNDHSVKHIGTELLFNFGLFSALRTFSRLLQAARLTGAVLTGTEMTGQAVILGASTWAKERFIEKGRPLTEAEVKELCLQGVAMYVAIAVLGRVGQPILKELEGAGHVLGARIKAANDADRAVKLMATALRGNPNPSKALELIQAERSLITARMEAYEALEARMAEEVRNPPRRGESVFEKSGLTPERVAEIKRALGAAQAEMKAAEAMMTLDPIGPDTFACPTDRIPDVIRNLTDVTVSEDPATRLKTYTGKGPDGRIVKIVERVAAPGDATGTTGDTSPPVEANVPPKVDTSHLPEGGQSTERWATKAITDEAPGVWGKKSADGRVFKDVYAEWMRQPERVRKNGDRWEPVYPDNCPAEFKPIFDRIAGSYFAVTTQGQANLEELRRHNIDLNKLDPTSAEYLAQRPRLLEILGEQGLLQWETSKLADTATTRVGERIFKILGSDALAALRSAFPDCEIMVTGSATQTGKALNVVKDLDIVLIVQEGTMMEVRIALEARARSMKVRTTPDFVRAGGPAELSLDAKAMTQGEYLGTRSVVTGRTPMDDMRVDTRMAAPDAARWVEALKARLSPEELRKLEQMTGGGTPKSPEEIRDLFGGRLDTAIERVRAEIVREAAARRVRADSRVEKEKLRTLIQDNGLMRDPEIQRLIDSIRPDNGNLPEVVSAIRGKLAAEIAARNAEVKFPGAEVLRDVGVWIEYAETDIPTWRANHSEMKPGVIVQVKNGKVHLLSTDIDVLVISAREPGRPSRVMHREEVKSGARDTAAEARDQLLTQRARMAGELLGGTRLMLEHNGRDITGDIDLTSDASATMTARGPAGKEGFNGTREGVKGESSGITAQDLEALVKDLIRIEQDARAAGPSSPEPTTPPSSP